MKILQSSSIITLAVLAGLVSCQEPDKTPDNVMKKLFNIDTDKSFYVTLPNYKNQIKLTDFTKIDTDKNIKPYVKGVMSNDENYSARLDYTNITALNISNDKNVFRFIAPYILTNNSPASANKDFHLNHQELPDNALYLGDFELDYRTNNINQYVQQLLGKYSSLDAIDYDGKKTVHVTIRQYPTQTDQDKKINSSIHKLVFDVGEVITLIDETVVE